MLNFRSTLCALLLAPFSFVLAQGPGSTPAADFFVHHKHVSIDQSGDQEMGSAVAIGGDVLLAADDAENVEILRMNEDGTWSYEASLAAPSADISFGSRHAMATNGDWIAIGAKLDDSFGSNSGAVHMYKFDGADWDYRGALSHMAPFGNIVTDQFGMALAMDGDRMVVGSRAENGVGAAGAVHYFTYNTWLDMWLETGFVASEHTSGNSTSKFAESVDISGDWMIVGEHRNNTNGQFAGAAHIYEFYNQCWHLSDTFYGDEAGDWLGYDVTISGSNAAAGAPHADTDDLNEAGAAKLYQRVPFSGAEEFWSETFDIAAPAPVQGDWFGHALDMDGDLLLVGAPRDDDDVINGGVGYFMFDCSTDNYDCVAEGLACDAMQNDRLGMDVALSNGLGAVGAPLDDNIFEDAGSVYVLGANDIGFECDLTAPGAPMVDLVDENDTGADNSDDLTRHTTPDFDLFLPDGGLASAMNAQPGDLLTWYLEDPAETETLFLTEDDIDNGLVTMDFVYPGPVLPDGEYTFCSFITDIYGNIGDTGCLTIIVDNEDPEPAFEGGAEYDTSNTDTYGAYLPGASDPADCEALAAASGGTWDGVFNDAETNMVTPGCYITGGTPYQASNYEWQALATVLPDTTLYLDAMGDASLELPQDNISATDNIAMDTLFSDITEFDCSDVGLNTITLTAIDMAGNYGYSTFQVEIVDNIAPEALTQDVTVQLGEDGMGSTAADAVDNGSNDVCGIGGLALSQTDFDCSHLGQNTVTLTVTDVNGNTSTAQATVTVVDLINPTAVAQGATVELDASGMGSITVDDIDNGSSDNCTVTSTSIDIDSFDCDDLGANTVTLTVVDQSGNTSTAQATVTVVDLINPTAVAQGATVQLDASGMGSITVDDIDNGSSDNCTVTSTSIDIDSFDCDDLGANTVTLTVIDQSGNTSTAQATVTVVDLINPTAVAQGATVELDASGMGSITVDDIDNGSSDNCTVTSTVIDIDSFDCGDLGANTVTLTVTDQSGNTSTAQATVTVVDLINPTAVAQGATVELDASGMGSITVDDIDNGSSDNCTVTSTSIDIDSFDCGDLGANTVTLTVVDQSGNTSTAQATVTVVDLINPTAVAQGATVQLDASGMGSITVDDIDNGSSDNCTVTSTSIDIDSFDCDDLGANTVTLTVIDQSGNTSTAQATVTVVDLINPTAVAQGATVELDASGMGSITVNDIENGSSDNCTVTSTVIDIDSFGCGDLGANTVTLTVTDQSGNTSTAQATVTVVDLINPAAVAQGATVELDASGMGSITVDDIDNGSSDNCTVTSTSIDIDSFDCDDLGSNTVTLTVTDQSGNTSTAQATVTVVDLINPTAVAQGATVQLDASGMGSITVDDIDNGSSDNCTVTSTSIDIDSFDCDDLGANTVTLTVIDQSGNTSTAQATVTVVDLINPTAVAQGATVELDASGMGSITVNDIENGSSDNCTVTSTVIDIDSFDCDDLGANTVTLTVTDQSGNEGTAEATVTVLDKIDPVAIAQDVTVSLDASGMGSITATDIDNGSSDNCAVTGRSIDIDSFDCDDLGANTVTLTVTDQSGNTSTAQATVTVVDLINPTAVAQGATVELDASGMGSITVDDIDNSSSDNCTVTSTSIDIDSFDCGDLGANTVTLTVVDQSGNTSTAQATVTVVDLINPTAVAQGATVELDASGMGSITVDDIDNGSSDNCTVTSTSIDIDSFDCDDLGANTVTLTVVDQSGNTSTAQATVTVVDLINPTAVAQGATVQLDASGMGSITVDDIDNGSSDNCTVTSTSIDIDSFDCDDLGANTVTLTVIDQSGNTSTAQATVTVVDLINPTAVAQGATVQLDASGMGSITVDDIDNGSSDNCTVTSTSIDIDSFDCDDLGANTVTLTVIDQSGNTSTAQATVTVVDNIAPVAAITCPADYVIDADSDCAADVTVGATGMATATATDNCTVEEIEVTYEDGEESSNCQGHYTFVRTFTAVATDESGNDSDPVTCTQTITVNDNTNPTITVAAESDVYERDGNEAAAFASWLSAQAGAAATDNCSSVTWTHNSTGLSDGCGSTGSETVTFTATDDCGNFSTTEATFTVEDNYAPSCPAIDLVDASDNGLDNQDNLTNDDTPTMRVMFTGSSYESAEAGDVVELHVDGALSQTTTIDQVDVDNGYAQFETGAFADGPVSFSARHIDDCGQASIFAFLNIIIHSTNPTPLAQDMTLYLDEAGNATLAAEDVDNGSSDDFNVLELSLSQTDFDCSHVGSNSVTFMATDIAGNFASQDISVTVLDEVLPTVLTQAHTLVLDEAGMATLMVGDVDAGSTDACGIESRSLSQTAFDCSHVGDHTVTLTVIDNNGNSASATAVVSVQDNTSPSVVVQDITVELDANGEAFITASDIDAGSSDACGVASMTLDITSFDCSDIGSGSGSAEITEVPVPGTYTIDMQDDYGDGWQGDGIMVTLTGGPADGQVLYADMLSSYSGGQPCCSWLNASETITIPPGTESAEWYYTGDSYPGEVTFQIYGPDGALLIDAGPGLAPFELDMPTMLEGEEPITVEVPVPGDYAIDMQDDYGDGWQGDGIMVTLTGGPADGQVLYADMLSSYSGGPSCCAWLNASETITIPPGTESAEWYYTGDSYPGEVTFQIYGPDGALLIDAGPGLAPSELDMPTMSMPVASGSSTVTLTVIDVNGNVSSATAAVTVEDNQVPEVHIFDLEDYTLYAGETCVDEVDLFAAGQPWYEATDNCDTEVNILYDEINDTGIAGCREFDRRWIIEAVDAAGNVGRDTTLQHIVVMDGSAPMVFFDNAPEDMTIELGADCTAEIPGAGTPMEFVDVTFTYTLDQYAAEGDMTIFNSDGDVVEFIDLAGAQSTYDYYVLYTNGANGLDGFTVIQTLSLAPGEYSFLLEDEWGDGWVYSSVDGSDALVISGNAAGSWDFSGGAELSGTFTVNEALAFDMTATATDNCTSSPAMSDLTYVDSAPESLCEDAGSFVITRTFSVTATDDCGNETIAEHIQTLTFLDVTAPQITDSEGVDNGETLSEAAGSDIFDFIFVPNPINLDAEDACGGSVTIEETESFGGFIPTDDIGNYCGASTPAAFLDGDACNGGAPAALVLEGSYFNGEGFTIAEGGVNIVESFYDESLHIEVEVTNADGTGGFIWSADYNEAFNWSQWSNLGRGYKKDCANVLPGSSPWAGWEFLVMQTGGMIGTGIYAGSELSLTHQPMNYYYGLQVGLGANNQNAKYGASAWFYWSGQLVVNGASQGFLGSSGDIMLDLDCTMPWSADYGYTVSDACGNTTSFSYTVEGDESNAGGAYVSGDESGHQPFDISVVGDIKEPIRVTGLMPNPTDNVSQLGFVVSNNMRLRVDLYSMSGELVQALYDGNAMTDVEYLMTIDVDGLDAGMYQIRIASNTYMAVKKLLVTQ